MSLIDKRFIENALFRIRLFSTQVVFRIFESVLAL